MKNILIYLVSWLGMTLIAIFNGTIREKTYGRTLRALAAHQLSTITMLILLGFYIWVLTGFFPIESSGQAFLIGCLWCSMTIAFEFGFGHFFMGHSWDKLFHDYRIFKGRIWSLVVVFTAVAPYIFYRMRIHFLN